MPVSVLNSNDTHAVADVGHDGNGARPGGVGQQPHRSAAWRDRVVVWVQGDAVTADESVGRLHAMSMSRSTPCPAPQHSLCGSSDHREQL